jgi:hypothetical protein
MKYTYEIYVDEDNTDNFIAMRKTAKAITEFAADLIVPKPHWPTYTKLIIIRRERKIDDFK